MSAHTSPTRFAENEDAFLTDADFRTDISRRMRVPHKISMNDYNDVPNGINTTAWNNIENLNMHVPDRIVVTGHDKHIGMKAPPREIQLDNSLLSTGNNPEPIRVATPPRVITLDLYQFPTVEKTLAEEESDENHVPVVKPKKHFTAAEFDMSISLRETSPPIGAGGDGLTTSEEVLHLRRQMAKMNRRIMALELENLNRLQKEKVVYGFGLAYLVLKVLLWLNRS